MNLSASTPLTTNYRSGLANPNWHAAMVEEFQALVDNNT
jgi:hypothetical protein